MGLSGRVPRRVDEATKIGLLDLIDHADEAGWNLTHTCRVLEVPERRVYRWQRRREAGQLADAKPGAAVHGLLQQEAEAILDLFEDWAEVDRSHRKLAHRGSYLGGSGSHPRVCGAC